MEKTFNFIDNRVKDLLILPSYFVLTFVIFISWNWVHFEAQLTNIIRQHLCADSQSENPSSWWSNYAADRRVLVKLLKGFIYSHVAHPFCPSSLERQIEVAMRIFFIPLWKCLLIEILNLILLKIFFAFVQLVWAFSNIITPKKAVNIFNIYKNDLPRSLFLEFRDFDVNTKNNLDLGLKL